MNTALSTLRKLEKHVIYSNSTDNVLELSLNKILDREIAKLNEKLSIFQERLSLFSIKYKLDHTTFEAHFNEGKLGDSMDFMEWISTLEMKRDIEAQLLNLQAG